jgi:hypothetical protein
MTISDTQARAARSILKLEANTVAKTTGISIAPFYKFEAEGRGISKEKIAILQKFYESQGIEFLEYDGVRRQPRSAILQLEGHEGFKIFMQDVLNVAETIGGDICVSGVDERDFEKWQSDFAQSYLSRMAEIQKLNPFQFYILIRENDNYFTASAYAQYRHIREDLFVSAPFYVYGDRLAMILFEEENVSIYIIKNQRLADAQRKQFNIVWNSIA